MADLMISTADITTLAVDAILAAPVAVGTVSQALREAPGAEHVLFVCFADDVKQAYAVALEAHGGAA